jgi:hypothetical protein
MSTFTIGSFSANQTVKCFGQSFKANVAGPNGTGGGPGAANPVFIMSASIGFPTSSTSGRPTAAYIYTSIPSKSDLSTGVGALGASTGHTDENLFGAGTFSRTYTFAGTSIDPATTYYLLIPSVQNLRNENPSAYAGGSFYDQNLQSQNYSLQFQISLSTV